MIVSVRSRMLLVMALFLASILVVLLVQRHSGQAAHRAIRETREDEIRQLLRDVIDLRGEPLRLFAYDYSYWDELVGYLKSPDPTWARENLEVGVLSFKLDGVRIVDLSGRLISEHWREGRAGPSNDSIHFPLATASPISLTNGSAVLSSDTLRPWFQHGFSRGADSELYEFRIAPIQPTSDAKRVSRPLGFLLAFKAWDDAHLGELTDMTGCELELAPVGSNGQPKTEESGTPHSGEAGSPQIILDIPLPPSGAAASAYLHVRYFSPSLARFHIEAAKPFTLFFATGSFGLLLALLLLNRWVAAPLKGLTRSLSEGSLEPARPLMAKSNEFGELARLLERFHVQRDELGRSRERLKTLIGNLPGMVYSVLPDEPGTILYISDGCRALTGYTPEELMGPIGRPFNSLVHPEDHDAAWGEIKRALAEGRRFQVVYRIVGRTGEIRWVREQGIGIFNREGKPERIDIFAEDITERRKNEQLLAEREEIFSTVVNSIQDLILLYDTTGRISGVWSGLLDHGDFRADIFIGKTDLEILGPEHGKIPSDAVQDALGGISQTVEFDVKESRMQRRIEANFAPVRSQDGSIVGVVSVARDVTAIREAERTIQLERDRFRLYLDAAAGIVAALDREGRILLINMPGAQLLGINREEAVGRDWFELTLRDESAAKWKNAFLKAVQDSREWSRRFESEIGRPPGGTRTFLWHITILRGSTGAEGGLIFGQDITYLKRAERALRESEEQYHQFFEDDLTGDFISTPEGRFIDCNAAFVRIFGFASKEEALATPASRLYLSNDDLHRLVERLMKEKRLENYRCELKRIDGRPIQVIENIVGSFDEAGSLIYIKGYIIDDTERYRSEFALRESEERYRSLFESSPVVLYMLDPESGQILDVNQAAVQFWGWTREQLLLMKIYEINGLDEQAVVRELTASTRTSRRALRRRHRLASGDYRDVEVHHGPIVMRGRVVILVILHDITDRLVAERALAESEEHYRTLIEKSNDAIYLTSGGKFEIINRRFGEILEVTPEEVAAPGFDLFRLVAPESREMIEDRRARLQRGEKVPDRYEFIALTGTGKRVEVEVSVSQVEFRGRPATQGILRDVTERKRLEAQLLQSQKMEAIGRLAGGVAHDFNNILLAISASAELLEHQIEPDSAQGLEVRQIQASSARGASLTRQLLSFARQQSLNITRIEPDEVVKQMEPLLRRLIRERIELTCTAGLNGAHIQADRNQIELAVMNLVVNARDALGGEGRIAITSQVYEASDVFAGKGAAAQGRFACLAVTDNGVGMSPEIAARAIEPFFTTKPIGQGTGLGLSTVHGIVRQSGGHVFIDSEPGRGTTVRLCFPITDADETMIEQPAAQPSLPESSQGQETVLIVDDEDAVRGAASRYLAMKGYRVLTASGGFEALDVARNFDGPIDLLLTDMVMPGMPGYELACRLEQMRPDLRVIFMSGYSRYEFPLDSKYLPELHCIEKPFRLDDLGQRVRKVLGESL